MKTKTIAPELRAVAEVAQGALNIYSAWEHYGLSSLRAYKHTHKARMSKADKIAYVLDRLKKDTMPILTIEGKEAETYATLVALTTERLSKLSDDDKECVSQIERDSIVSLYSSVNFTPVMAPGPNAAFRDPPRFADLRKADFERMMQRALG